MHDSGSVVVSDTTAIIALTLIDKLELLPELYGRVAIPPAVSDELLVGASGKSGVIDAKRIDWLHIKNLADPMLAALFKELKDSGFRLKDDLIQEAVKLAGEI